MHAPIPTTDELATTIQIQPEVVKSLEFLLSRRKDLDEFSGVEHFAIALADGRKALKGHHHHLVQVRAAILRELWPREIFIGRSVIDELLFEAVKNVSMPDPIRHVLEFVRDRGLHQVGFMVYPVHSLGVLGAGFLTVIEEANFSFSTTTMGCSFIHKLTTLLIR